MGRNTAEFLRLLEKQNADIAAMEAEKEAQRPQPDLIRLQREKERREKYETLRARRHPRRRTSQVRNVFGYTDLT